MIICPNCKNALTKDLNTYRCCENHCFDISKSSHINLLISKKSGDDIGDNKQMVQARTNFLNLGYYENLANKLCDILNKYKNDTYLDCGCGQGYYTKKIANCLQGSSCFATDISKNAVMHGAKNDKNCTYFVSSVFEMPLKTGSIDILTSLFSPLAYDEFYRVLSNDGHAILVVSGKEHLFELKEKIYENPYKNDDEKHDFKNFDVVSKENLTYTVNIEKTDDIKYLFSMTPYAFKTSKQDALKLDYLSNLDITLDFAIYILKKSH